MGQTDAEPLDDTDKRVLDLLAQGMSDAEIAGTLFVSESLVGRFVGQVFRKLGVSKRQQAGMWWIDNGWDDTRRNEILQSEVMRKFLTGVEGLSPRERDTLDALVDYPTHSLAQLAVVLGISLRTVNTNLEKISSKCKLRDGRDDTHSRRPVLTTRWHLVRAYHSDP